MAAPKFQPAQGGGAVARVKYGVHDELQEVVGKTIKEVREEVRLEYNLDPAATVKNAKTKKALDETYIVQEGDIIEFTKALGEKG